MPDRDANIAELLCYRCGSSLTALTLPFSRRDLCPECGVEMHVCRMCSHYAPSMPDACDEEDAPQVRDKVTANFCDYFCPCDGAFDGREKRAAAGARQQLGELFGEDSNASEEGSTPSTGDQTLEAAEKLFR